MSLKLPYMSNTCQAATWQRGEFGEKSKEIQSIRKHTYILDSILEKENGSYTFLNRASEN